MIGSARVMERGGVSQRPHPVEGEGGEGVYIFNL